MSMDYRFSEDQELLQQTIRRLLKEHCPPNLSRLHEAQPPHFSRDLYRQFGALGWLGLLVGDSGAGRPKWTSAGLFHQEVGRILAPGPMYSSAAVCGPLLAAHAPSSVREAWLPGILAGTKIAALALLDDETTSLFELAVLHREAGGYRLSGRKALVEYAGAADLVLVTAGPGNASGESMLAFVDPAAPGVSMRLVDHLGSSPRGFLEMRDVQLRNDQVASLEEGGATSVLSHLEKTRLLRAAEAIGIAEGALDLALEYARSRVQYGRPIGTFQAIQQKAADMAIQIEAAKWLVYYALWCLDHDEDTTSALPMALLRAGPASRAVTSEAVQIHGGVGVMEPYEVGRYYRRAKAIQLSLGYTDDLEEKIAAAL